MYVLVAILLASVWVVPAWAEEQPCRPPLNILVGVTRGIVEQAADLVGKDKEALKVLIDRGVVLWLPAGTELFVKDDDLRPWSAYKQVRRPGTPDWVWAISGDYGCPKPEKPPAEPNPPKAAPKKPTRR